MAVTDFFAGEIATELLRMLITITRKACLCKPQAEQLILTIDELLPIITDIKHSGVEVNATSQHQLKAISRSLTDGHELAVKVLGSSRWNVYQNLQLSRKMEKLEKEISRLVQGPLQAHLLAHVYHVRFDMSERVDRIGGRGRTAVAREVCRDDDDVNAYRLDLPEELSGVHDVFHVSNLKKCLADESLVVPLDDIQIDEQLRFVEEPVEIMDQQVKTLKHSKIPIVKVRWNSRRGPEFTWERKDQMEEKYPHLFPDKQKKDQTTEELRDEVPLNMGMM